MPPEPQGAGPVAPPPLTIRSTAAGPQELALSGEIDLATSHLLTDAIAESVAAGVTRLTLDFSAVTFVNSTGLGAMVAATKELRALGGDLVLRHFQGIPTSALATAGLDRFLTIET